TARRAGRPRRCWRGSARSSSTLRESGAAFSPQPPPWAWAWGEGGGGATPGVFNPIVIDLQDIGVRFYTYASTMGLVMEEAARRGIAVVVLDRPSPIDGWRIEGT